MTASMLSIAASSAHAVAAGTLVASTSRLNLQGIFTSAPEPSSKWIAVPDWFAGTWSCTSQTILQAYDYRNAQVSVNSPIQLAVKRSLTIGVQRDRSGQIWHLIETPYSRMLEGANFREYQKTEAVSDVHTSPNTVTMTSWASVLKVDKQNTVVLDSFQEKTKVTYSRVTDNLIKADMQVEDFDYSGARTYSSVSVCTYHRTAGFAAKNRDGTRDIKRLFDDFIRR